VNRTCELVTILIGDIKTCKSKIKPFCLENWLMEAVFSSELIFADGDVLLTKTEDLQHNINCWNDKMGKGSMQISLDKEKYDTE
jgi:hypothetical protein